jgi:hypothetical protein
LRDSFNHLGIQDPAYWVGFRDNDGPYLVGGRRYKCPRAASPSRIHPDRDDEADGFSTRVREFSHSRIALYRDLSSRVAQLFELRPVGIDPYGERI